MKSSYWIVKDAPKLKKRMLGRFEERSGIILPDNVKRTFMSLDFITLFHELMCISPESVENE